MNFPLKRPYRFITLLTILCASQMIVIAQDEKPNLRKESVKPLSPMAIDQQPEFPGGKDALYAYLSDNLTYPDSAKAAAISGRVVTRFVVLADGNITDIAIVETPGYGLSEEVIKVVKGMPRWKPGMKDGKAVSVYFALPVFFTPSSELK